MSAYIIHANDGGARRLRVYSGVKLLRHVRSINVNTCIAVLDNGDRVPFTFFTYSKDYYDP